MGVGFGFTGFQGCDQRFQRGPVSVAYRPLSQFQLFGTLLQSGAKLNSQFLLFTAHDQFLVRLGDRVHDIVNCERFEQEIGGVQPNTARNHIHAGVSRHQDDRGIPFELLRQVEQVHAGTSWHTDVGQHDIIVAGFQCAECFFDIGNGEQVRAVLRDRVGEEVANRRFVIHDQQLGP